MLNLDLAAALAEALQRVAGYRMCEDCGLKQPNYGLPAEVSAATRTSPV